MILHSIKYPSNANHISTNVESNVSQDFSGFSKEMAMKEIREYLDNKDNFCVDTFGEALKANIYTGDSSELEQMVESQSSAKNTSKHAYEKAKKYLIEQMETILITAYQEEGLTQSTQKLLGMARNIEFIFEATQKGKEKIVNSSLEFANAMKSHDKEQQTSAANALMGDIAAVGMESSLGVSHFIRFFSLANLTQEDKQQIAESLAVFKNYADMESGANSNTITLENGTTISWDSSGGVTNLKVTQKENGVESLLLNYVHENFNTLLQLSKHTAQEAQNNPNSSDSIMQSLFKEVKSKSSQS